GGGKNVFDEDQEGPHTQGVTREFPGASIVGEHRVWAAPGEGGSGFGNAFYAGKGALIVDDKGRAAASGAQAGGPSTDAQPAHFRNFLDCVKSREAPNAEIEIGHLTTRLCHLGNIAHRVGRKLTFEASSETFPGDGEANALLSREYGSRF